jgi:hypothetical protein
MPTTQAFSTLIGIVVIIYLAGAFLIAKYLERQHTSVWEKLGRPSLLNWGIANSARFVWTVLLGGSLVRLRDRKLTALVWTERVLIVVYIAGMIWVAHLRGNTPAH